MNDSAGLFEKAGGEFLVSPQEVTKCLAQVKAFVFDWDGVFNSGQKGEGLSSGFTEPDAVGINMLRFGHWLMYKTIPVTAIITGVDNPSAARFAGREHLHALYSGFTNKIESLNKMCETFSLKYHEIAFCFDDILDLSAAEVCGLRFNVRRNIPAFASYIRDHKLCDYITAALPGNYAVREVCELVLSLQGNFSETLKLRTGFGSEYRQYLALRNAIKTGIISI